MNRHLADYRLWQFSNFLYQFPAEKLVSVAPFCPENVNIDIKNNIATISGYYGIDLFKNHEFVILLHNELKTYTTIKDIPLIFDNLIKFKPDDTHDITITYTFELNNTKFDHTHWIHHDMEIWEDVLKELISRENNGGWK